MMECGFRIYGGQTNTAVEIDRKRMRKLNRDVSVITFGYNAKKRLSIILKRCNS